MKTKKAKKEQAIRIFESIFNPYITEPTYDEVFDGLHVSDQSELQESKRNVDITFEHEIELDKKGLVCIVYFEGVIDFYDVEITESSFMLVSPSGDTLPDYTKFDL